ncbi:glutaredoxin [Pseudoscourfieldia marina]
MSFLHGSLGQCHSSTAAVVSASRLHHTSTLKTRASSVLSGQSGAFRRTWCAASFRGVGSQGSRRSGRLGGGGGGGPNALWTVSAAATTSSVAGAVRGLLAPFTRRGADTTGTTTTSTMQATFTAKAAAGSGAGASSGDEIQQLVAAKNAENAVIIYSKTYCPFCTQVKSLFASLNVTPAVIEIDQVHEEREIQAALQDMTGQRTVPNIFIGGKHVGGCDDTMRLNANGELAKLLEEAGAK